MTTEERIRLINYIHNLANDLRSNLITWEEFDKKLEAKIFEKT